MVHRATGLSVVLNGEIYNYLELRRELESCGHRFESHSDTEVLLASWAEWGLGALARFNGMFAFVLLDPRNGGIVHAVRDRFGVKPLYWMQLGQTIAFGSEIKQLRSLPEFVASLDLATTHDYLAIGRLDHSSHTFDSSIEQLTGGERAVVRLNSILPKVERQRWYSLTGEPIAGGLVDAASRFRDLLTDSIRLRLRADVPIGSCLSGGLDSSAIVCLAHTLLRAQQKHEGQITVTARFSDAAFDEWQYAARIIEQTGARPVEVWPTVERLQAELDSQLWHMDEPYGSTSQFSQWCVFDGAANAGLKVMLDGQGSDEQLAGYAGNETALYTGLLRRGNVVRLTMEALSYRRKHANLPLSQLLLALRNVVPAVDHFLPSRLRLGAPTPAWLRIHDATHTTATPAHDLNDSLLQQTLRNSLPVLLRYEDRNSMARSIEARVPFLDYRLVEFLAGVPATMKLHDGVTKLVMREGLRDVLPPAVRDRRDKMGFVTPEETWLRRSATDWFRDTTLDSIHAAADLIDVREAESTLANVIAGKAPFSFAIWRLLCFGRWLEIFGSRPSPLAPYRYGYAKEAVAANPELARSITI